MHLVFAIQFRTYDDSPKLQWEIRHNLPISKHISNTKSKCIIAVVRLQRSETYEVT